MIKAKARKVKVRMLQKAKEVHGHCAIKAQEKARKERIKVKKVKAKERRMKAKESEKVKEVHGYQPGTAGKNILRGNLFFHGNLFGDGIKKEKENTVSGIRWSRRQRRSR